MVASRPGTVVRELCCAEVVTVVEITVEVAGREDAKEGGRVTIGEVGRGEETAEEEEKREEESWLRGVIVREGDKGEEETDDWVTDGEEMKVGGKEMGEGEGTGRAMQRILFQKMTKYHRGTGH